MGHDGAIVRDVAPVQQALAGRYQFRRELGEGAFATVYLAEDLRHSRSVAIKVLRVDRSSEMPELRFVREIKVLAQLQHPNILPLLDSGHVLDRLYLVTPYIEGESLAALIARRRQLTLEEALDLAVAIADALAYAHRRGVVHRDIKPENILMSGAHPVLADFGIARLTVPAGAAKLTRPGDGSPGTPAYMSPEQLLGDADVDGRSDTYSLGCVLFEMLLGKPPFAGRAGFAARFAASPPRVREVRADVPAALDDVLAKALASEPGRRYESAALFQRELCAVRDELRRSRLPPEHGASGVSGAPARVPPPAHRVIGRDDEMQRAAEMLQRERLVTLVGPGGVGKTSLARQLANHLLAAFENGAVLVPFAGVTSPDDLAPRIGGALGISISSSRDAKLELIAQVRKKEVLLVLDEFEHLVRGAPFLEELLLNAPGVKVLVTSRERLSIAAEVALELRPLAVSGMDAPRAGEPKQPAVSAAVQVLVDRGQHWNPGRRIGADELPHLARIASLLGGLPLALEMAASMMRVLSCAEVAQELERGLEDLGTPLRGVPERHQSLRKVFESSWMLLESRHRDVLLCLSILRAGFRRAAAERIAGASLPDLMTLVDKSVLARSTDGRFQLHEVLRQFVEHELNADPKLRAQVEEARCAFFIDFLDERAASLRGRERRSALREIDDEVVDIRAAWTWAITKGRTADLNRACEPLRCFFSARGRYAEGVAMFGAAAAAAQGTAPEARLFGAQSMSYFGMGNIGAARIVGRRAIEVLRQRADDATCGEVFMQYANVAAALGRHRAAQRLFRASIVRFRSAGLRFEMAQCIQQLANGVASGGNFDEAERLFRESEAALRKLDAPSALGFALNNHAVLLLDRQRPDEAETLYRECLPIFRALGDQRMTAGVMVGLAKIHLARGEYAEARRLASEGLALFREIGRPDGFAPCLIMLGNVERELHEPRAAAEHYREALASALAVNEVPRVMECAIHFAGLLAQWGDPLRTLELLDAVEAHAATRAVDCALARSIRSRVETCLSPDQALRRRSGRSTRRGIDDVVHGLLNKDFAWAAADADTMSVRLPDCSVLSLGAEVAPPQPGDAG